jgi:CelD/BcsL family acetyltransferase involved in cellulose biosynthesis
MPKSPTSESVAGDPSVTVLRHLPDSWNELRGSFGGPLHELDWAQACIDAFRLDPYIVAVGPPERPRALAPLALVSGRAESIGVRHLSEPLDCLFRDEAAAAELAVALARLRRPLLLRRVPTDSPVLPALRRALGRTLIVERPNDSCPVLALDESWVEPEARLSSRRRSDIRRARRHAGQVQAEVLIPTAEEAPALIETALRIERKSWKGRNGSAVLQLADHAAFFRRFCMMKARDGSLRLAFLRVDGEDAAMQIAVERDNAFWLLKIGYDEKYAHCSPGQLLIGHTIAWAAARKLTSYEFLGKAADWIRIWTEKERLCSVVGVYPPRPASAFAAVRDVWEFAHWKMRKRRQGT